jgi:hypothetical protein
MTWVANKSLQRPGSCPPLSFGVRQNHIFRGQEVDIGFFQRIFGKKQPGGDLRSELLNYIEVYCEAMHFLATCGDFDASKFERLDAILSRAGASFGPSKRQEMLSQAAMILPTRTTGGLAELHVELQSTLAQAFQTFNEMLVKVSPTPETAREVQRIIAKYRI